MDIESILKNANPDIVIFLFTTLAAFISWIVKSLIEKPISESKNTFNKFLEKRIEILTEVKTRLNFIAYFPVGKENLTFKNQLQEIILKDGKTGYLSKATFDSILKISIDKDTDEKLLLTTINDIDKELYLQISKVQDEISFYRRFSNYNPLKLFIGLTLLSLQYIISLALVISVLYIYISTFWIVNIYIKCLMIIISGFVIYFINRWLKK